MLGTRDAGKLKEWREKNAKGKSGSFSEAAKFGEIVVLAVKGLAAKEVLEMAGEKNLEGKIIIDTTNPIADAPPENGVIKFFTNRLSEQSKNASLLQRGANCCERCFFLL